MKRIQTEKLAEMLFLKESAEVRRFSNHGSSPSNRSDEFPATLGENFRSRGTLVSGTYGSGLGGATVFAEAMAAGKSRMREKGGNAVAGFWRKRRVLGNGPLVP
ncbi:hypothetical protein [Synoicihabitans lomoniglobus]|uniref:Uncharacterized protein n=1 Tax=Synoicihabitans lomoniglobus TaxID=2909285 RepID=A0AAE9ZXF0_9BACT|nr:hypothetical protein [Opitutaceae bacterium LMO-M01]WED65276.1 hypothetical protein PXH66_00240 [Opitutaceae bacterium LMO-M01]